MLEEPFYEEPPLDDEFSEDEAAQDRIDRIRGGGSAAGGSPLADIAPAARSRAQGYARRNSALQKKGGLFRAEAQQMAGQLAEVQDRGLLAKLRLRRKRKTDTD